MFVFKGLHLSYEIISKFIPEHLFKMRDKGK